MCVCKNHPDKEVIVETYQLTSGKTRSCGCLRKELAPNNAIITHGMTGSRLYSIYCGILSRCHNKNVVEYKNYGGRGIKICQDWDAFLIGRTEGFLNFYKWANNNGYKDNLTIDRIDNDNNYCPNNCRWITKAENNKDKRNLIRYNFKGKNFTLPEWSRDSSCIVKNIKVLRDRIEDGWSIEKAISVPVRNKRKLK